MRKFKLINNLSLLGKYTIGKIYHIYSYNNSLCVVKDDLGLND